MVTATLEKFAADGTTLIYTMTFTDFTQWGGNANFPVVANPIPQEDSDKQILLKIMGNSTDTRYGFIMKDRAVGVVTDSVGAEITTTRTVPEQIAFWLSSMRPVFIDEKYTLTIKTTPEIQFQGVVSNFKWDFAGGTPVTAQCSFQFMQGEVIASSSYEKDASTAPLNNVVDSPAAGQLRQDWDAPEDEGTSSILSYAFKYRLEGEQKWTTVIVSPPSTTTHTVSGLSSGTYEATVAAKNDTGEGTFAPITKQVVA